MKPLPKRKQKRLNMCFLKHCMVLIVQNIEKLQSVLHRCRKDKTENIFQIFYIMKMIEFLQACKNGNIQVIEKTTSMFTMYTFNSGFGFACENGHIKIVQLLLKDTRVNINIGMRTACRNGYVDVIKVLLEDSRADPRNDPYSLEEAIECNQLDAVKILLTDHRVDPTVLDNYPIIKAAIWGYIDIVKRLMQEN